MVDAALALPEDTKLMILAPVVADRKGEHSDLFDAMQAQGFVRFRVRSGGGTAHEAEAKVYDIDSLPKLKKTEKHTIEVVVDRVKVRADIKQRLAESFETALRLADGRAIALEMDTGARARVQLASSPARSASYSLQELEPRAVLVQQPDGRLPELRRPGPDRVLRPEARGGASPTCRWPRAPSRAGTAATSSTSRCCRAWRRSTTSTPIRAFEDLPANVQQVVLHGSGEAAIPFTYINENGRTAVRAARVRGDHPEPGAPLPRDRFGGGARGTRQVPEQPAVPGLRRHAAAREARHVKVGDRRAGARPSTRSTAGRCATR